MVSAILLERSKAIDAGFENINCRGLWASSSSLCTESNVLHWKANRSGRLRVRWSRLSTHIADCSLWLWLSNSVSKQKRWVQGVGDKMSLLPTKLCKDKKDDGLLIIKKMVDCRSHERLLSWRWGLQLFRISPREVQRAVSRPLLF